MVTLIVVGSIASLKLSYSVAPGSTSMPSLSGVPAGPTIEVTCGTMIVVKVQVLPWIRRRPTSTIGFMLTVYVVSSLSGFVGDHAYCVWPENSARVPSGVGLIEKAACTAAGETGRL